MLTYLLKRSVVALLVAFTVSIISFALLHLSGNLAQSLAGPSASADDVAKISEAYGFDRPFTIQYLDWASGVLRGDFGESYFLKQPVFPLVMSRLPVTLVLGVSSLTLALLVSIPLGIIAALRPNSWIDRTALTVSVFGQAMPSFWFGLLLMSVLAVSLRWLPVSGSSTWYHFIMPTITLAYYSVPPFMRLVRGGMMEVLAADFIRTARAKGLRPHSVIFKHALRNAVVPLVAVAAVQLGAALGGSVVIESVFRLNGVGFLAWESITRADFPVVQAIVLILSCVYIFLTLVADVLNAILDPRIHIR
ncbi:ABC transporter permease [Pseudosulfitobacter sp. DSM 107133]|uniref:ABC transporter permease n=1 Tax=Pseudosulfitobacter sp. DSM 107133 TaxID=2883100 RepID=UPI000DF19228|nr:ABC transporter permease [Pseudosulfitobacter sp. DSM 107133]UOA29740.1 Glutathione transport system permease protein GsiC [Pseudosulfitobacter sp. DSM 107133]